MSKTRYFIISGLIVAAALSRLVKHPDNFAPIMAIALFGGACFPNKIWGFLAPLTAMVLSDFFIGFHKEVPCVYGAFALVVCLGFLLQNRRTFWNIAGATLAGSVLFFLITNFGVWLLRPENQYGKLEYEFSWAGLMECYYRAIPFFRNSLLGDAVYVTVLFGSLALIEHLAPAEKPVSEPSV
jgi:hypothetical protein